MVFPLFFRMVLLYYEYKEWNNRKKASQMDEKDFELLRVLEDTKNNLDNRIYGIAST